MAERRERTLPGIVSVPLNWLHHRWNEALYGFPQGHIHRIQMEVLLGSRALGLDGIQQLTDLLVETHSAKLQRRMAEKIRDGVAQLRNQGSSRSNVLPVSGPIKIPDSFRGNQ